jgi:formamidopyrimidine-DNA glycosylase
MPELTAVQFMTENLRLWLQSDSILSIEKQEKHNKKRIFINDMPLPTGPSLRVERRGKASIIYFNSGMLVLQYQLSGKMIYSLDNTSPKGCRILFHLKSGNRLCWMDKINFGFIHWCNTQSQVDELLKNIGPEFWPIKRNASWWKERCHRATPIHKQLIDQKRIAGIGNIIAIEVLHRCKIHPRNTPKKLDDEQWKDLSTNIRFVVEQSRTQHNLLREQETAEKRFFGILPLVSEGHTRAEGYQIYGRSGEQCPSCKNGIIEKSTLGGRPIYTCPLCQPVPK